MPSSKLYRNIAFAGNVTAPAGSLTTLKATDNIAIDPIFDGEEGADFAAYIPEEGPYVYNAIGT